MAILSLLRGRELSERSEFKAMKCGAPARSDCSAFAIILADIDKIDKNPIPHSNNGTLAVFTKTDLKNDCSRLSSIAAPALTSVFFSQEDFNSPSSEQSIWIFKGSKMDFESGLLFFIKTIQAQPESNLDAYIDSALCTPISESNFKKLILENSGSLSQPLPDFLFNLNNIQTALLMDSEWNDVGAIAETSDAFIAFYWFTTA